MKFIQTIDYSRPHTALTEDTRNSERLIYRYDDNLQEVSVPNVWYNRHYKVSADNYLFHAKVCSDKAENLRLYGTKSGLTEDQVRANIYKLTTLKEGALYYAKMLLTHGDDMYPVKGSNIPYNKIDSLTNISPKKDV